MVNPQKENGHLDIANELVEQFASLQLSGYEWRILWAIWRKTWAWHKKQDWISFSQFRELTNIGNDSHISRAIKRLVLRQIVTKIGKKFSFNKHYDNWLDLPKLVTRVTKIGKKKLPKMADTKEIPKETITKETISKDIVAAKPQYGRGDINLVYSYLKEKLGGSPDGSVAENRKFAKLLIDKMKKDYPDKAPENLIYFLIERGIEDQYIGKNITSFKYLYYNAQKIIQSIKLNFKKIPLSYEEAKRLQKI